MTATTLAIESPPLLDTSTGDLVLRLSSSSRDGQIVRLRSAKCTIGSAPQCTLRLVACGVAPVHCLLLRGPAATVARCWSADTRLNGASFDDAVLSCGDRLSIGPIELEVLEVGATSPARQPSIDEEETERAASRQHEQFAARLAELEAEQNALTTERDDLAARRNALAEERRQWQDQQEEMRRAIAEEHAQLAARSVELESQQNALADERRQWQTDQEANLGTNEPSDQVGDQMAELESQRTRPGHAARHLAGRARRIDRRSPAMGGSSGRGSAGDRRRARATRRPLGRTRIAAQPPWRRSKTPCGPGKTH